MPQSIAYEICQLCFPKEIILFHGFQATDADAEPPNNVVRYEIIQGNYDNKFYLNEVTGELVLREPVNKTRYIRQNTHPKDAKENNSRTRESDGNIITNSSEILKILENITHSYKINKTVDASNGDVRTKRAEEGALFTLTARAYDLGEYFFSNIEPISMKITFDEIVFV